MDLLRAALVVSAYCLPGTCINSDLLSLSEDISVRLVRFPPG